ncbi:MAG: large subunit ribosomal protein [Patescibacteria group bacterium]|jgi:large subunit ribosomal protein L13|nr:large subunit ribosomal protein [Patescibacteria group bacterium]
MKKQTPSTKQSEIKHEWHMIDLKDQVLGRVSTDIAHKLMGKGKSNFVRNLDCGDYVVVTNAKEIKVTGKKEQNKMYYRHSGYPGGFKAESLRELRARKPEEVIRHAVKGMLPQNRLRDRMLKRLFIFAGEEHTYADKFKSKKEEVIS